MFFNDIPGFLHDFCHFKLSADGNKLFWSLALSFFNILTVLVSLWLTYSDDQLTTGWLIAKWLFLIVIGVLIVQVSRYVIFCYEAHKSLENTSLKCQLDIAKTLYFELLEEARKLALNNEQLTENAKKMAELYERYQSRAD